LPQSSPQRMSFETDDGKLNRCMLFDPFHLSGSVFSPIFEDPGTVKIFHACQSDLQVLTRWCGGSFANVFDTQLAACFCDFPYSISLAKLTEALLGVTLPKTETRSDWLHRPLTEKQMRYGVQDVAYLDDIVGALFALSERYGTTGWMLEEMEAYCREAGQTEEITAETAWRKIHFGFSSGFKKQVLSNPECFHRLYSFAAWREEMAKENNIPRRRVASDDFLVISACRPPVTPVRTTRNNLDARFSRGFDGVVQRSGTEKPSEAEQEIFRRLNETDYERIAALKEPVKEMMRKLAEQLKPYHIQPQLFATRDDLVQLLLDPEDPDNRLNIGWRYRDFGEMVDRIMPAGLW
ncbi:MAG: ribonuclease D, partial [Kiritimatiellia bacterium]